MFIIEEGRARLPVVAGPAAAGAGPCATRHATTACGLAALVPAGRTS